MNFTKEGYIKILNLIKDQVIDFHTPGPGIILRHDVDNNIEMANKMALLEYDMKVKSTYFILDTAPYWRRQDMFKILLDMQNKYGHEIGWHNNAITVHLKVGLPVHKCISMPIEIMRQVGLNITGSASHGDAMCHERNYLNYNVFGFIHDGWTGYKGEVFNMKVFDLEYEAYHVGGDGYLSDSGGQWSADPEATLTQWVKEKKRNQLLIHPQWWAL